MNSDPKQNPSPFPSEKPTWVRHEVLGLLTLAAAIAYLTRNAVSVAESTIREDLGLTLRQSGWFMAAFFLELCSLTGPQRVLGPSKGQSICHGRVSMCLLARGCLHWSRPRTLVADHGTNSDGCGAGRNFPCLMSCHLALDAISPPNVGLRNSCGGNAGWSNRGKHDHRFAHGRHTMEMGVSTLCCSRSSLGGWFLQAISQSSSRGSSSKPGRIEHYCFRKDRGSPIEQYTSDAVAIDFSKVSDLVLVRPADLSSRRIYVFRKLVPNIPPRDAGSLSEGFRLPSGPRIRRHIDRIIDRRPAN